MDPNLVAYVETLSKQYSVPAVTVSLADGTCLAFGAGKVDTVYQVCSNTKLFIAIGMGMLVDQGKVRWDDTVKPILPEFSMLNKHTESTIQVQDLLCHVIGKQPLAFDLQPTSLKLTDMCENFASIRFTGDLLRDFNYQNEPFAILCFIIGRLSGDDIETFFRKNVFDKLSMASTSFDPSLNADRQVPGAVATQDGIVHWFTSVQTSLAAENPCGYAGGIHSSAGDMAKWLSFLLRLSRNAPPHTDPCISHDAFSKIVTAQTLSRIQGAFIGERGVAAYCEFSAPTYGLGVQRFTLRGIDVCCHEGDMPGAGAFTVWSPGSDFGITILTNVERVGGTLGWLVGLRAMELHFDISSIDWATRLRKDHPYRYNIGPASFPSTDQNRPPKLDISQLCGVYTHPSSGRMHVFKYNTPIDKLPLAIQRDMSVYRKAEAVGTHRNDRVPDLTVCVEDRRVIVSYYHLWRTSGDVYWGEMHCVVSSPETDTPWKDLPPSLLFDGEDSGNTFAFALSDNKQLTLEQACEWSANLSHRQGDITWEKMA